MFFAELFASLAAFALLPIFWVPLMVVLIIMWCFVVSERGGFATLFTIAFAVLVAAKFPAIVEIVCNPLYLVCTIVGYAIIGVLWSHFKWSSYLSKRAAYFVGLRNDFLKARDLPIDYFKTYPDEGALVSDFADFLDARTSFSFRTATKLKDIYRKLTPSAAQNKGSIVMWIAYWPISVVWFVVADLVTEVAEAIYRTVGGHFQKMSNDKFDAL